jgi:glycosyltransferase involved in cell wall biosynthesis
MSGDSSVKNPVSVSVIVPCRNEIRFISSCLNAILSQNAPGYSIEILVADGMSDDGTREVLERFAAVNSKIRLVDNPGRIVSTGLNAAIRAATGQFVIRVDVHTEYDENYIVRCVEVLQQSGADNVGGPARTKAGSYMQKANCLAYHSPFSVGGARFHNIEYEGYVDTVTYGCWSRQKLLDLGMFDEDLVRNQDDELNLRIIRSGGKIWQSPKIRSWYYPRSSLLGLFRQYSQYGYWKVRVIQKHKIPASIRHVVPGTFVFLLILLAVLSLFFSSARLCLIILICVYLSANLCASVITCRGKRNLKYLPIMPIVFACYHLGYGAGFLLGFIDFVVLRKGGRKSFGTLTRG